MAPWRHQAAFLEAAVRRALPQPARRRSWEISVSVCYWDLTMRLVKLLVDICNRHIDIYISSFWFQTFKEATLFWKDSLHLEFIIMGSIINL